VLTDKLCIELKKIAANFIPAKDLDDLTQVVFEQLLLMDKGKLEALINTGDIHRYFNRMCKLSYYSKNSQYYYIYHKIDETISFSSLGLENQAKKHLASNLYITTEQTNTNADVINSILDELYWYDRELFRLYVLGDENVKKYTYTSLAKKTGISRISIYYTIKSVKKYVIKRLKEINDDI
jgi:hypothetical protein|tara:strand:+ start:987 stop:1529 length:543 start_codon:yes stop_codon:yes gene_type:complete